jgi:hypothetical protein
VSGRLRFARSAAPVHAYVRSSSITNIIIES